MASLDLCSVAECGKPVRARGWCCNHYALWERNGAPVYQPKRPPRTCVVPECNGRRASAAGYCGKHLWRVKKHGNPDTVGSNRIHGPHCNIEGCDGASAVGRKGMCEAHYQRERKRGDALAQRLRARPGEPKAWLLDHVHHEGDKCLTWPYARHSNGEAAIGDRRSRQAARLMCILVHGDPPFAGAQAAHGCGKGHLACVNPKHLRWASPKENTADQLIHGTRPLGGRHSFAKLDELQVRAIRSLAGTFSVPDLAELFGVHAWTIACVIRRKTWAWLE